MRRPEPLWTRARTWPVKERDAAWDEARASAAASVCEATQVPEKRCPETRRRLPASQGQKVGRLPLSLVLRVFAAAAGACGEAAGEDHRSRADAASAAGGAGRSKEGAGIPSEGDVPGSSHAHKTSNDVVKQGERKI
jgi:hypothetical protein